MSTTLYARRRRSEIPKALAFAYKDPGGGPWTIAARCPYCCQDHIHNAGCGPTPSFPGAAVRCGGRSYSLTPMDFAGS
ncbi:hypothetical protein ACWF95_38910 [Streptomyces vinaceus]